MKHFVRVGFPLGMPHRMWGIAIVGALCAFKLDAFAQQDALIRIDERIAPMQSGAYTVELTLHNLHDDLNLNEYTCHWTLLEDGIEVDGGDMRVDLPPRESMPLGIRIQPPDDFADHEFHLRVVFLDQQGNRLMDEVVWLKPERWREHFLMRLRNLRYDDEWQVFADRDILRADHESFSFHWTAVENRWFMLTRERNVRLIINGPYIIREVGVGAEADLGTLSTDSRHLKREEPDLELLTTQLASWSDQEDNAARVKLDILLSPYGFCDARFSIPMSGPFRASSNGGGLAFVIPDTLTQAAMLGEGALLADEPERIVPNVFHPLSPIESWWEKSLRNVQALAIMDERGYGLGMVTWDGRIELRPHPAGTLVVVIAAGSDSIDLEERPLGSRLFEQERGAAFRMLPLIPGRYPALFSWLLGD